MDEESSVQELAEDPVEKLIHTSIPERLWHYTDIEGFRGIVNSRKIRATDVRFLNDKEEFKHALVLAKALLLDVIPSDTPPEARAIVVNSYESVVERGSLSPRILKLFTASFTVNGDQLSQWRGYSRGSTGVSLGFDLRSIRDPALGTIFAPCVYRDGDKEKLLRYAIVSYVESMLRLAEHTADLNREQLNKIKVETGIRLVYLIALLKHSAFEEEQEWRLVLPYFTNVKKPAQLQFRSRSTTLVPFVESALSKGEGGVSLLKEVILGPGSDGETAADAARAFLASASIEEKDVAIRESRIPYRPW